MTRQTPAPPASLPPPQPGPVEPAEAARLRKCLRSPSGRAVMLALSATDEPLSALDLCAVAYVSRTSARDQGWRAARLGYAAQGTRPGRGLPTVTWQITDRGREFVSGELA